LLPTWLLRPVPLRVAPEPEERQVSLRVEPEPEERQVSLRVEPEPEERRFVARRLRAESFRSLAY